MKKYIFCLTIMATAFAFAPQAANAQTAPLGKGITMAGIKRNENLQRTTVINILSQAAPGLGMSTEVLIDLYDSGAVTIELGRGTPVVVVQHVYIKKAPTKDEKEKKAAKGT